MNIRISQFLNAENITQAQFADTIGVARASISHIIAGRNKPSYDFITSVLKHYPRLNPYWLMLGKGRMYIDSESKIDVDSPVLPQKNDSQTDLLFPLETAPAEEMSNLPGEETVEQTMEQASPSGLAPSRRISRIIVLFDDGTFHELRHH